MVGLSDASDVHYDIYYADDGPVRREGAHCGRFDSPVALCRVEDRGGQADAWLDVGVHDCRASVTNLELLVIGNIKLFPRGHLCIRLNIAFYRAYAVSTLSYMFSHLHLSWTSFVSIHGFTKELLSAPSCHVENRTSVTPVSIFLSSPSG